MTRDKVRTGAARPILTLSGALLWCMTSRRAVDLTFFGTSIALAVGLAPWPPRS